MWAVNKRGPCRAVKREAATSAHIIIDKPFFLCLNLGA
jgi:hypothetical protein